MFLPPHELKASEVRSFERDKNGRVLRTSGLVRNGYFHPYRGFNRFLATPYPLPPAGWTPSPNSELLQCDPPSFMLRQFAKRDKFQTHDNGGVGFIVGINRDHASALKSAIRASSRLPPPGLDDMVCAYLGHTCVHVFGQSNAPADQLDPDFRADPTPEEISARNARGEDEEGQYWFFQEEPEEEPEEDELDWETSFTKLIKTYDAVEVFVGKSPVNDMTSDSGNHGPNFDGNSVLLFLGTNAGTYQYAHIGVEAFEFSAPEPVLHYTSSVGRNDVAYPYAESKHFCFSMVSDCKAQTPVAQQKNRRKRGHSAYTKRAHYEPLHDFVQVAPRFVDDHSRPLSAPVVDDYVARPRKSRKVL
jgi:hypothetical protein